MTPAGSAKALPISPILVSPDGRHFVGPDGRAVFWLGDTQWDLFRSFRPEEALEILRHRQALGVNVILVMLLGVNTTFPCGGSNPLDKTPYRNLDGEGPWLDGDPSRPNEAYFRNIDTMIRLGDQTGQTFVVGVYHQWDKEVITPAKARPWAHWLGRRYRDVPNLIWCMYPKATAEYVPICRQIAAGLREGDGGTHMISIHPDPSVASSSFMHAEPWLDFNMIQTCTAYDKVVEAVSADYARVPVKPVVLAEGGYEGEQFGKVHAPLLIRQQAYWTALAGGYHVYGHNDAWSWPRKWAQWLDTPGVRQLRIFREIITSLEDWWELVPDQSLLGASAGSGMELSAAARSASPGWVIAYLSHPGTVTLGLDAIAGFAPTKVQWINPATGETLPAKPPKSPGPSFRAPTAWEDAVLIVKS